MHLGRGLTDVLLAYVRERFIGVAFRLINSQTPSSAGSFTEAPRSGH